MSSPFARFLQILITLLLPILLVLGSGRLLITDEYLAFEYGKASFPADPFGFDQSQRLNRLTQSEIGQMALVLRM